jgi:plasmid stabilization system protein ParE
MRYRLTLLARCDIREVTRYIRTVQHSPQNAQLVARRLTAQFRKLAAMPGMGFQHPEIDDPTARIIPVTGLLVVYDPTTNPLMILRVLHPARNLGKQRIR